LQNDDQTLKFKQNMSFEKDINEILLDTNFYILLVDGSRKRK